LTSSATGSGFTGSGALALMAGASPRETMRMRSGKTCFSTRMASGFSASPK
jgi:hypothetical protein